jgi:hypothetical protein
MAADSWSIFFGMIRDGVTDERRLRQQWGWAEQDSTNFGLELAFYQTGYEFGEYGTHGYLLILFSGLFRYANYGIYEWQQAVYDYVYERTYESLSGTIFSVWSSIPSTISRAVASFAVQLGYVLTDPRTRFWFQDHGPMYNLAKFWEDNIARMIP